MKVNSNIFLQLCTLRNVESAKCGQYEGTRYYHRCNKEGAPETLVPTQHHRPAMCAKGRKVSTTIIASLSMQAHTIK